MRKSIRKFQVSIIGSSVCNEIIKSEAYKIGHLIGKKGFVLINGGRTGVMEASEKGCIDANGVVIGIIPDPFFDNHNDYCSIVIPTGIGFARNIITALAGDIILVVGGESGTLCELSYAWAYKKDIICCSWIEGVSKEYAGKKLDNKFVDDQNYKVISALNIEHLNEIIDTFYNKFINNY